VKQRRSLKDFEVDTEGLGPLPPSAPLKSKPKHEDWFSIMPEAWDIKLCRCKHWAAHNLAVYLLREGRMNNWQPVKVTNVAMKKRNIDRKAKAGALHCLEKLGLIKVWRGGGKKSPVVVFLVRG
jgi:hypothetical protein